MVIVRKRNKIPQFQAEGIELAPNQ